MSSHALPVLLPNVPDQRWSCHSCGQCCRTLVGHLSADEAAKLDRQQWEETLSAQSYVRIKGRAVLNKRKDGACVFLDGNNRCLIHAKFGESAKPLACRIFPFSVRPVEHGWQASFRFDCPSSTGSIGVPISQHRSWVAELAAKLPHEGLQTQEETELSRGMVAKGEELDAVTDRLTRWLKRSEFSMRLRLIGCARLTTTLAKASLDNVRGSRFLELLNLLVGALPDECRKATARSTAKQRSMLRQVSFAHVEHASLRELQHGLWRQLGKRGTQLVAAQRFLFGLGTVPLVQGIDGRAKFATVQRVRAAIGDQANLTDELILRYVRARLLGRSVFGPGYYGWPVFSGLSALWLSVAAIGWLARYSAATRKATMVEWDDVARVVGLVDRAATRLPALGTAAERTRIAFLWGQDGLARLLCDYFPVGERDGYDG